MAVITGPCAGESHECDYSAAHGCVTVLFCMYRLRQLVFLGSIVPRAGVCHPALNIPLYTLIMMLAINYLITFPRMYKTVSKRNVPTMWFEWAITMWRVGT